MKFEVARIRFLSHVFLAVAVGESAPSQSLVFAFLRKSVPNVMKSTALTFIKKIEAWYIANVTMINIVMFSRH